MGKLLSKQSKNVKSDGVRLQRSTQNVQEQYEIYNPDKYDIEAIEKLRKEFKEEPEIFILNMLLMSFMFFDDYQEEIRILANTSPERGKRLNAELIQEHQKQMVMPDPVFESVNRRVKFRPTRGPKKGVMEPLVAQRMFILHDTIEIEDKMDSVDYSRIDKPSYRAEIEESRENKGFVKVNLLGTSGSHLHEENRPSSADSACSTSSKTYQTKSEALLPNRNDYDDASTPNRLRESDSGISTAVNSDSDYGYTRITTARTPRRLYISEKDIYTNISQLPSKCITPIKVKNEIESSDSDSDDDESEDMRSPVLFLTHYYLNSTEFMSHFKSNVFPNYLAEVLGFAEESIQSATSLPGVINCDTLDDTCNVVQWEVIPSIPLPWPEIAYEWTLRPRPTVLDKREKNPIAYKWPTPKMIDETNKLNCVVIPKGYMPKKGENSNMHIEWEVGFPKAERYLGFRMSHAQMRLFLYIVILHKKFIEPLTQKHGLLIDHIRVLMLWECEANYKAWPEDKLGTKLMLILKTLYHHLGKGELPHYFIRSKNILENVPRKYIIPAQDIIHRILESPLSYALSALKHLKYMPGKFYPEPNIKELCDILTTDNGLHREAFLSIQALEKVKREEEIKRRNEDKRNRVDKTHRWNRRYMEQKRLEQTKKMKKNNTEKSKNLTPERRESTESTELNISVKKMFVENVAKQIPLLTFFIQHFLQIAKRSLRISTTNQTLFYLKQAWYLTMLLIDTDYESALKFQKQIKEEEENCHRRKVNEPKIPFTPKRNSTQFHTSEILQFKGNEINIAKLNKSYNANAMGNEPKPSTSGVRKKTKLKHHRSEVKTNTSEIQTRAEDYEYNTPETSSQGVEIRKHPPSIRKSVSFRTQDRIDLTDVDEDAETTSL